MICCLMTGLLYGKIRNGYEVHIDSVSKTLQQFFTLGQDHGHPAKKKMKTCVDFMLHYRLTKELLHQLRIISPGLYAEIDNLKDRQGRDVDVYIKLVPHKIAVPLLTAASFYWPNKTDPDACYSEYGHQSVSLKLGVTSRTLRLLYHEFGHIQYIVPNLATYTKFYRQHYDWRSVDLSKIGHAPHDESGKNAEVYEKKFCKDYRRYLKKGGHSFRPASMLLMAYRKESRRVSVYSDWLAFRQ